MKNSKFRPLKFHFPVKMNKMRHCWIIDESLMEEGNGNLMDLRLFINESLMNP